MMNATTIMVQIGEERWTEAAVDVACKLAKARGIGVALAKMIPTNALAWTGIEADEYLFSESDLEELALCERLAACAGVEVNVRVFGYTDLAEGLAAAADALHAEIVLAPLPQGSIPFLSKRQVHHLSDVVEAHHHHLMTVEPPVVSADWQPEAHDVE